MLAFDVNAHFVLPEWIAALQLSEADDETLDL